MSDRRQSNTLLRPVLSRRETLVALELATAKTCGDIAAALGISSETVKSVITRIRGKTMLRKRPELAVWSARNSRWLKSQLVKSNR